MQTISTRIEFQMSLLLFAALAGHLLAISLRQPAAVGEILMGLVLGPTILGWITHTNDAEKNDCLVMLNNMVRATAGMLDCFACWLVNNNVLPTFVVSIATCYHHRRL